MAIQLSPSVLVKETDLTNVIPAVSASTGAAVIESFWGPVSQVTDISSENQLATVFGKPKAGYDASNWFAAANFLGYTDSLKVVRVDSTAQKNAVATLVSHIATIPVTSGGSGYDSATINIPVPSVALNNGGVQATAEAVIVSGVIQSIRITNAGAGYDSAPVVTVTGTGSSISPASIGTVTLGSAGVKINNKADFENVFAGKSASIIGMFAARYPGAVGNGLQISYADATTWAAWSYKSLFSSAPGTSLVASGKGAVNDELHIVVIDKLGVFSGVAGSVLETYAFVSKASDSKFEDGSSSYYKNVLNSKSNYVYSTGHQASSNWGTALTSGLTYTAATASIVIELSGGADYVTVTEADRQDAFVMFDNDDEHDISLVICGKASTVTANFVISNVAERRKDCIAFVSPTNGTTGEPIVSTSITAVDDLIAYKNAVNVSTSYAVYDSGYKYQYDRYNDIYRWVPLCGDVAGLCARTDATNDPWWSPAGLNRGQIKNVVKLGFNPRKSERDALYQAGINPVVSFPGQGTVLYGDKTALAKPSAFDRINVRRLFITLQKAIATSAKYQLFEFNDAFTRAQFRNMVEPYLRDVQGRRGITDFKVVCDESNNTGEVIDTNRFVADIYIKPARSINFITLNFVATRTSASFSEIAGGV